MAINATIFKAEVQITDLDRHYYADHQLTIARHPSETDSRMMVRLVAFAFHAGEALQFTRGISTEDEPDLWQKSMSGEIELWIELGQPDEKRIRKACGRARKVIVYTYQQRSGEAWW
ncbi:MAG TPA: YaeQ family protein, partial [Mariprofundaceae bacterium]|nr:YaeQ family protein [Mariprofundaceae bacterium]